jgi:hypothetical protein
MIRRSFSASPDHVFWPAAKQLSDIIVYQPPLSFRFLPIMIGDVDRRHSGEMTCAPYFPF